MLLWMFLINILFLNFNNPLIMGILMMIQMINLILLMGKIFYSFWFSFIIFLIFIGGLFILFIYVISLIYNNKFMLNFNKYSLMLMFISIFLINYKMYFFINNDMLLNNNFCLMKENLMFNLKFYNMPNNLVNLMLISYLFLLMVIVVKITNFFKGPIKNMN